MKKLIFTLFVGFVGQTCLGQIAWEQGTPDEVLLRARVDGKSIILFWSAVWCTPCTQLKNEILSHETVQKELLAFHSLYLDIDADTTGPWAARYEVSSYPTIMLLSPAGQIIDILKSGIDVVHFSEVLSSYKYTVQGDRDLIRQIMGPPGKNLLPSDLIRALAKNWYWSSEAAPFANAEEKITFYRAVYRHARAQAPDLVSQAYFQYLQAQVVNGHTPGKLELKGLQERLKKIIAESSLLRPVIRVLPFNATSIHKLLNMESDLPLTIASFWQLATAPGNGLDRGERLVLLRMIAANQAHTSKALGALLPIQLASYFAEYQNKAASPYSEIERRDLAEALLALKDASKARYIAETSLQIGERKPPYYDLLGQAAELEGKIAMAATNYQLAAISEPNLFMKEYRVSYALEFSVQSQFATISNVSAFLLAVIQQTSTSPREERSIFLNKVVKKIYDLDPEGGWRSYLRSALQKEMMDPLCAEIAKAISHKTYQALPDDPQRLPGNHVEASNLLRGSASSAVNGYC